MTTNLKYKELVNSLTRAMREERNTNAFNEEVRKWGYIEIGPKMYVTSEPINASEENKALENIREDYLPYFLVFESCLMNLKIINYNLSSCRVPKKIQ